MLDNHTVFTKKTVRATLKVLATLIDWNDLSCFDSCRVKISSFLREFDLRSGAIQCLGAIVGKGMPEVDKLRVVQESGFLEEVRDANYV